MRNFYLALLAVFGLIQAAQAANVTVVTASGNYTAQSTDEVIVINKSVGEYTVVYLPENPSVGKEFVVKDGRGDASLYGVELSTANQTIQFDDVNRHVMASDYMATRVIYDGSQYRPLALYY